jgi:periplasmic protein TonB
MEAKKNPKQDVHRQSGKFFLIGLTLSVALAITAFEWRSEKKEYVLSSPADPFYDGAFTLKSDPVSVDQPKIKEPKPPVIKPKLLVNLVVTTEPTPDNTDALTNFDQPDASISIDSVATEIEPTDEPFIAPEVAPVPEGGFEGFYKFLGKNLKYPRRAQQAGIEGKVFVEFIIDRGGRVSDLKVVKGLGSGCDEEALRVLALTKWQPGRQRGQPVKVRMTMPLNFILN